MAMYTMLQSGSRGEEVKKMQQALESAGYSVGSAGVDGIYGPDTEAAVRRYQTAKQLRIDGIAGDETLGSLYGTPSVTVPSQPATPSVPAVSGTYDPASDPVYTQALAALGQVGEAPRYTGSGDGELEALYAQIVNREPFRYDPEEDALYRQYRDAYTAAGRLAMLDTVGQAAALTGGYGSSYAQSAGQQQYGAYLQQLSGVLPELYGAALDRYQAQGAALEERYALAAERQQAEYDRYAAALAAWQKEAAAKAEAVREAYDQGYDNWRTAQKDAQSAQKTAYDRLVKLLAAGYTPTPAELAAAGMTEAQANALRK